MLKMTIRATLREEFLNSNTEEPWIHTAIIKGGIREWSKDKGKDSVKLTMSSYKII